MDLQGLMKYWRKNGDYVVIPLLGRVKGESHDLLHLIHCTIKTISNINVKKI